jgi:hypothetical protein
MRGKFISYLRVSTDKQGEHGYGIDAQRKAVADFLNGVARSTPRTSTPTVCGAHCMKRAKTALRTGEAPRTVSVTSPLLLEQHGTLVLASVFVTAHSS